MALRRAAILAITSCLLAGAAVVAYPVSASASATNPCASSAKIISRSGKGYLAWAGKETNGSVKKFTGKTVTRGQHFYELQSLTIKLSFGKNTFKLGANAVFQLGCSGIAVGDKAVMPSIYMLRGSAIVHTTHTVEGSISTEEGLYGQPAHSAGTVYSIVRKLKQKSALTMSQKWLWYQGYRNQPKGSTTSKTLTHLKVNVTPYVGPSPGTCRQVRSAVLTTTKSYGHGTAVYHF